MRASSESRAHGQRRAEEDHQKSEQAVDGGDVWGAAAAKQGLLVVEEQDQAEINAQGKRPPANPTYASGPLK
jgi:hypothetical protein